MHQPGRVYRFTYIRFDSITLFSLGFELNTADAPGKNLMIGALTVPLVLGSFASSIQVLRAELEKDPWWTLF